jgi:predicted N-formylglutamate amidohydrolase
VLSAYEPALILSLHSFTPRLSSDPAQARPWHVGVLYNQDERAARLALDWLAQEPGLCVGDQQPYSGRLLNATMNRHAEAHGRPYVGLELRQDLIGDAAGQARMGSAARSPAAGGGCGPFVKVANVTLDAAAAVE